MSLLEEAIRSETYESNDSLNTETGISEHRTIFSKNLQFYIRKRGMVQKDIAQIIGVSTSTFSEWMNGKKYPRIEKIEALAECLNVSVSDLVADPDDINSTKRNSYSDNISITIGNRIRDRRKALKMSADELAERIGKDRATVYRYESGKIENMPLGLLSPLATALNVTIDYFMNAEPAPNTKEHEQQKTDVLDVVLRLHTDTEFLGVVEKLCTLDNQKLSILKEFLNAFC